MLIRKECYDGEWMEFEVDPLAMRLGRQRRRVHGFCKLIEEKDIDLLMVTLTYKDNSFFGIRDVTDFIRRLKRRVSILAYTWVMEMQARGVPHYHLIIAVNKGVRIPLPDKVGLWDKGFTRVEVARSVWYVAKYTGKEYQKKGLPKYFHMYCVWVSDDLMRDASAWSKAEFLISKFPGWVSRYIEDSGCRLDWMNRDGGPPVERVGSYWEFDGNLVRSPFTIIQF